ncbi:MAG: hypothetical protein QGF00_13050 [Planctomycetota bacterium]|jgi:hypothetical protein|nr:hypothetical protein [Planctomycetota bacterium]MDP7250526.1 hypothetical protein [Planctomycetota bacterium]
MTENEQEIDIARSRLKDLRIQAERIVTDSDKLRRVKDMELAGIHGMIEQVENEIRELISSDLREQVGELRSRLHSEDPQALGEIVDGALDVVEQLASNQR